MLKIIFLMNLHWNKNVMPQERNMANKNAIPIKITFTGTWG